MPWVETTDDFGADFDVPKYFGFKVFIRDGGDIFRSYFTDKAAKAIDKRLIEELQA